MSGAYTLPSSSGSAGSASATNLTAETRRALGYDIWFDVTSDGGADYSVTASGDWAVVAGLEALRQSIIRRLITSPGDWALLPDYGCGVPDFVKAKMTTSNVDALTARIKSQLLRDVRVKRVASVEVTKSGDLLKVAVYVVPAALPEAGELKIGVELR